MVAGSANTAEYCHPCQSKEPTNSNRFNHGTDSISWRSTSAHFSHGRRRTIDIAAIYQVAFSVDASIPETKQQGEKDCRSSLCTTNCSVEPWSSLERDHESYDRYGGKNNGPQSKTHGTSANFKVTPSKTHDPFPTSNTFKYSRRRQSQKVINKKPGWLTREKKSKNQNQGRSSSSSSSKRRR